MSAIDRVKELLAAATAKCVCTDYRCEHRAAAMELSCVLTFPIVQALVESQAALKRCESMISEGGWADCTAATEARDALLMDKLEKALE